MDFIIVFVNSLFNINILTTVCGCSLIPLQYRTDLVPIVQSADVKQSQANYVYVMPDYHNPKLGHPVFLEITPAPDVKHKIIPSTSKGMNVLGIVIFSATMGKTNYSAKINSPIQCAFKILIHRK